MSNLVHLGFVVIAWSAVAFYLKASSANRFRMTLRLLQILPVLFAVDFAIGYTVIETWYGPHASAGWISKSAIIYPAMFLVAIWQLVRSRKTHKGL